MKKQISNKLIIFYCLPQFAVGLFTTMINNYLLYFYQPSKESGVPTLITQGIVFRYFYSYRFNKSSRTFA